MWPFSKKVDPQAALDAAVKALQSQTPDIETSYAKAGRNLAEDLEGEAALMLLFGFVDYFAAENGITKRKDRVKLTVSVFRTIFGELQGIRMFGALESAMRAPNAQSWSREGFYAAKEFDEYGLKLVTAFFEGKLNHSNRFL